MKSLITSILIFASAITFGEYGRTDGTNITVTAPSCLVIGNVTKTASSLTQLDYSLYSFWKVNRETPVTPSGYHPVLTGYEMREVIVQVPEITYVEDLSHTNWEEVVVDGVTNRVPWFDWITVTNFLDKRIYEIDAKYRAEKNPPVVYRYSKLKLGDQMELAGIYDIAEAWMVSNKVFRQWRDAQYFTSDYPALISATNLAVQSGLVTDAQIKAMLEASIDE